MAILPRAVSFLGLILLAHAGYSAHEHASLTTHLTSLPQTTLLQSSTSNTTTPLTTSTAAHPLPLDIVLETLVAVFLVSIGLVLGSDALKPISWSVWAGEIEKEGGGRNPFRGLEERSGFVDIRAKRKEFADWVRTSDPIALSK